LCTQSGIDLHWCERKAVGDYLFEVEPKEVRERRKRKFKRSKFYAAGVMDLLTFDQHDKWKRFGLYLHLGIDPFSGRFTWLKIWWTNRNPVLVTSYYLEACRKEGGTCIQLRVFFPLWLIGYAGTWLMTGSDPGSENNGIANCHTTIRQRLDPSLKGTLQHKWMFAKTNIKSEGGWAQFRAEIAPGFEDILQQGVDSGIFNIDNPSPFET
jgi:hypothetical protein